MASRLPLRGGFLPPLRGFAALQLGLFDEVAFTSPSFWFTFAVPLMMVKDRRFTCTTTPPPPKTFFDDFVTGIKANMKRGDNFFELINHSLSCASCIDRGDALRCSHRLYLLPPWKPLLNLGSLMATMPKRRADEFAQEARCGRAAAALRSLRGHCAATQWPRLTAASRSLRDRFAATAWPRVCRSTA